MYAVAVALAVAAMLVLVLVAVEIQAYWRGRTLISRRRLKLRLVAGALLLSLLAAVFLGLFVLGLRNAHQHPRFFLAYWSCCLAAAIALIWVMLADLQEVEDRFSQRQQEIWRDMARFVGDNIAAAKRAEADSRSKKPE
jgi:Na+/melibiose symporter-like transporter